MDIFSKQSRWGMSDITSRSQTLRRALAIGSLYLGPKIFPLVVSGALIDEDAQKLAEIAGVQGAKNTWQTVPLRYFLHLEHISLKIELLAETQEITASCFTATMAKTGTEQEALAGVWSALLTLYDLVLPYDPSLTIGKIRLLFRDDGMGGVWINEQELDLVPEALRSVTKTKATLLSDVETAIITLSDRASDGRYKDRSGPALKDALCAMGALTEDPLVLPDDANTLKQALETLHKTKKLILCTGGTGIGPSDITPETLLSLHGAQEIPGFGERIRGFSAKITPNAWISRSVAVLWKQTLVIALPGSPKAATECLMALQDVLPHALDMMANRPHEHSSSSRKEDPS